MDAAKVGNAIRMLRLREGYTQQELANRLNVTDKAVSKWERGLSVPDISIVSKLALILNCDVDNLLAGNINYLKDDWQGVLILHTNSEIYCGSEVYGKPLVYVFLSYFMLAGIRNVYISCNARDRNYIEETIDNGIRYGINLFFLSDSLIPPENKNTMVVYNNPFVYGVNLTKYFQRAMSRHNGITIMTTIKPEVRDTSLVISNNNTCRIKDRTNILSDNFVPIVFVPKKFFSQMDKVENISELEPLYAEPMGNGMIAYLINDNDSLCDTSMLMKIIKCRMDKNIYDIKEISYIRKLI